MSPHEESVVHDFFKDSVNDSEFQISNRDDIRFDITPNKKSHINYMLEKHDPKMYHTA